MTFFQNIFSAVQNYAQNAVSGPPPFHVYEIYPKQFQKESCIMEDSYFALYKEKNLFHSVLNLQEISTKAFSICRSENETEGTYYFKLLSSKLQKLCYLAPELYTLEKLQILSDIIRNNTGYGIAHIAAKLKLIKLFSHKEMTLLINEVDQTTGKAPIHVAIETGDLECIKELIICKADSKLIDRNNWTVFHYAAKYGNDKIIQLLAARDVSLINNLNVQGESALHEACLADRPNNVELLLRWKCDPNNSQSEKFPIHCAMQASSEKCLQILCHWSKKQINVEDKGLGGTALHWAKNKKCISTLVELGADLEHLNKKKESPLLQKVREGCFECVLALLIHGANANAVDGDQNGCLHLAIEHGSSEMVQLLIVFGANVNLSNKQGDSVRHKAATSLAESKNVMLCYLSGVGAIRCSVDRKDCATGCQHGSTFDGIINTALPSPVDVHKPFEDLIEEMRLKDAEGSKKSQKKIQGDRILCLDGGGIRGLILIQTLLEIERITGHEVRNLFDWIGGTSTGGILALGIAHGKSMRYCQGMYFHLKDEVFKGSRPYKSEPLENFLTNEFGGTTRMTEITKPKVVVTAILADRFPTDLHLFRNYELGDSVQDSGRNLSTSFKAVPRPNEQLVWKAARSSGAAPTYFRASERFLDGGLMANNPTLDVLTEVNRYHLMLRKLNRTSEIQPIHVVVSLGTGRIPIRSIDACDVFRPEGIFDVTKIFSGAKNLGQIFIDQATQSEGRVVERAMSWCSMLGIPFFRFSPPISDDIPLDTIDDRILVNMLWETSCYLHKNQSKIKKLAALLVN